MNKNIFTNLTKILAFANKSNGSLKEELEYILAKRYISPQRERKLVRFLQSRFQAQTINQKEKLLIKETLKLLFVIKHNASMQKITL